MTRGEIIYVRNRYPRMSLTALGLLLYLGDKGEIRDYEQCRDDNGLKGGGIVCRAVDCLKILGLVTNDRRGNDRRKVVIRLSDAGKTLLEEIH